MSNMLIVGHLTIDAICNQVSRTAEFDVPQGAALGSALGAAVAGASVALASVVGRDFPEEVLETLRQAGISTSMIEVREVPTLRFWLLRETSSRCIDYPNCETPIEQYTPDLNAHDHVGSASFDAVHLCPMPITEQLTWARHIRPRTRLLSVDPQPFRYAPAGVDAQAALGELAREVDILSVSAEDFPSLMKDEQEASLRNVLRLGAKIVTLKMGAQGSLIAERGADTYYSATAIAGTVADETGAGDAYAGAFCATLAASGDIYQSAKRAAATARVMINKIGMLHLEGSAMEIDHAQHSGNVLPVNFS